MKFLQVGGCVRDALMGRIVHDRDWLVVGATPEAMLAQGFRAVGKDFPVFLHPVTHEEYALARTERKQGKGHGGFLFYSSPDVTIEQDLIRRDLTINAMALETLDDGSTRLIDPLGGQRDLRQKIFRHVSPAFAEDPLRVWRVARFSARFPEFTLAPETRSLMSSMVASGELANLSAERVWHEWLRGLAEVAPWQMLEVLDECGALAQTLPELTDLHGVIQDPRWHPEGDAWTHLILALKAATALSSDPLVRFGAICHDLGKAKTAPAELPHHPYHAQLGAPLAKAMSERMRAPKDYQRFATHCARWHDHFFKLLDNPHQLEIWWELMEGMDIWRFPESWQQLLLVVHSDYRARPGYESASFDFLALADQVAQCLRQPFVEGSRPTDQATRIQILQNRLRLVLPILFGNATG